MEVQCVVDGRAGCGESPVWSPLEEALWWVDIPGSRLHRFDSSSGASRTFEMPAPIGCVALRQSGGLLVALKTGLFGFDPAAGTLEPLAAAPYDRPDMCFSDGRCDHQGCFWVSTDPPHAGGLLALAVGINGLAEPRFVG